MRSPPVTRFVRAGPDPVKTARARLLWGLVALLAVALALGCPLVYVLARDQLRSTADQFVADKARILARAVNPANIAYVRFDERDWRADRFVPFAQTFDLDWNPRFVSSRLNAPILPTAEVQRFAAHPLGLLVHDAVGPEGERYRMATLSIERAGEVLGYAQVGVRQVERDLPLRRLAASLLGGSLVTLALALAGIWLTLRQWELPMATMAETARNVTASGGSRHRFVAPPDAPELVAIAHTFNDLLDHLATLQQSQQQLLADAAHELRTPLTVLRGELEVTLRRERAPAEYRETLETCRAEIERLSRLTDNLLTLARMDASPPLGLEETLDLGTLCREGAERFAPAARDAGIQFQIEATATLFLRGNRLALERVLANLLDNALRHTPRGETVRLRAFRDRHEGVVEVIDSGPGIAPEHHPRLFERFYRVETGRPRERGGAGLGLAIVKTLVTAHGGAVAVRSEVGRGSTFVVRLPLADRAIQRAAPAPDAKTA